MTSTPPLDDVDLLLLAEVERDPVVPLSDLAERLGRSERTVARRFRSLRERGLVRVVGRTMPDVGDHVAWLVRVQAAPDTVPVLAATLARHGRTRWVRATRDAGEIVYGLISPDSHADRVLERMPVLPGVRSVRAHELLQVWSQHGTVVDPPSDLDGVDRRLLALLAGDGRASNRELAQRIGVHETTVGRRRRRLEESGLLYYEADVAQEALGRRVDAFVWLSAPPGRIVEAGTVLQAQPECRFVAVTTGPTDLVANVACTDNRALVTLVDERLAGLVTGVEFLTMGRTYKRTGGPVGLG